MKNVKNPMEAGMLYIIEGETYCFFTKNAWIDDSDTSHHITKNDAGL